MMRWFAILLLVIVAESTALAKRPASEGRVALGLSGSMQTQGVQVKVQTNRWSAIQLGARGSGGWRYAYCDLLWELPENELHENVVVGWNMGIGASKGSVTVAEAGNTVDPLPYTGANVVLGFEVHFLQPSLEVALEARPGLAWMESIESRRGTPFGASFWTEGSLTAHVRYWF